MPLSCLPVPRVLVPPAPPEIAAPPAPPAFRLLQPSGSSGLPAPPALRLLRPSGSSSPPAPPSRPASLAFLLHRINRRAIIEFAVSDAIEEALPLVAVKDQHPPGRIARHPHQHPVP